MGAEGAPRFESRGAGAKAETPAAFDCGAEVAAPFVPFKSVDR